jgi:hypothetical protein
VFCSNHDRWKEPEPKKEGNKRRFQIETAEEKWGQWFGFAFEKNRLRDKTSPLLGFFVFPSFLLFSCCLFSIQCRSQNYANERGEVRKKVWHELSSAIFRLRRRNFALSSSTMLALEEVHKKVDRKWGNRRDAMMSDVSLIVDLAKGRMVLTLNEWARLRRLEMVPFDAVD